MPAISECFRCFNNNALYKYKCTSRSVSYLEISCVLYSLAECVNVCLMQGMWRTVISLYWMTWFRLVEPCLNVPRPVYQFLYKCCIAFFCEMWLLMVFNALIYKTAQYFTCECKGKWSRISNSKNQHDYLFCCKLWIFPLHYITLLGWNYWIVMYETLHNWSHAVER